MKNENIIQAKTYAFALRIVKLAKFLVEEKKEYVFSKQIVRSGTSLGANIEEAIGAQSKKDFYAKISIAYKEARETKFWLRLLKDADYLGVCLAQSFLNDIEEILKIIGKIQSTLRKQKHTSHN